MDTSIKEDIIECFKFIGKQALILEERQIDQIITFGEDYSNAPAYELLRLIDKYPKLKKLFVICIKDFIGELCERHKAAPEKLPTAPFSIVEFLMYILQWEEIYEYSYSLFVKAERPEFQRGLQAIMESFTDDWKNDENFDIDSYRRDVDIKWKSNYKRFQY